MPQTPYHEKDKQKGHKLVEMATLKDMLESKQFLVKTEEDEEKFFDRTTTETQLAVIQTTHSRDQGHPKIETKNMHG